MIVPADVDLLMIRAVKGLFPDARVATDIPSNWDWSSPESQLIVLTVVGGQGIREYAFDDARVTFEVYDTNVDDASTTTRHLYGHALADQLGGLYRGTVLRPVYHPYGGGADNPALTPGYWFTVELTFRSEEITSGL